MMGAFRWLTVGPPGQDDVSIVLMAVPGQPVMDEATRKQVLDLTAKGFAGTVFLTTDDCQADYDDLTARGVDSTNHQSNAVRHRLRIPRPVRQQRAPHPIGAASGQYCLGANHHRGARFCGLLRRGTRHVRRAGPDMADHPMGDPRVPSALTFGAGAVFARRGADPTGARVHPVRQGGRNSDARRPDRAAGRHGIQPICPQPDVRRGC